MILPDHLAGLAPALEHRIVVPGVGVLQRHRPFVDNADPGRGEHARLVALAQPGVDGGEDLRGVSQVQRVVLNHSLGRHHEQRGRGALAGDIGDEEAEAVFVDREVIEEVAAHLLGGVHAAPQVHAREILELRRGRRQGVELDAGRRVEIGLRGGQLAALFVEDDAVHDDQGHQDHAVLGCFAEGAPGQDVVDQRQEYERQGGDLLILRALAADDQYRRNERSHDQVDILQRR